MTVGSHRLSRVSISRKTTSCAEIRASNFSTSFCAWAIITSEKFTGWPGMGMLMLNPSAFWNSQRRGDYYYARNVFFIWWFGAGVWSWASHVGFFQWPKNITVGGLDSQQFPLCVWVSEWCLEMSWHMFQCCRERGNRSSTILNAKVSNEEKWMN